MDEEDKNYHLDTYGDEEVREFHDKPIPKFLKVIYLVLPIWGVIWWGLYWNGSQGFLDRGYWCELEKAAGTTFIQEEPNQPMNSVESSE